MVENLKSWVEKLSFFQCVLIFAILAVLRLRFFAIPEITFFEDNRVASISLALALLIVLIRILVMIEIESFPQRVLGWVSLVVAVVFLGNYQIYSFFLIFGFSLLRWPLVEKYNGLGWRLELPLALVLLANIWLGKAWLLISILVLLILNESFGERLKR